MVSSTCLPVTKEQVSPLGRESKSLLKHIQGRSESVTIKNDNGRLTEEEIDIMIATAEQFKEEDKTMAERVTSRNGLEDWAINLRNQVNDVDGLGGKLDGDDREDVRTFHAYSHQPSSLMSFPASRSYQRDHRLVGREQCDRENRGLRGAEGAAQQRGLPHYQQTVRCARGRDSTRTRRALDRSLMSGAWNEDMRTFKSHWNHCTEWASMLDSKEHVLSSPRVTWLTNWKSCDAFLRDMNLIMYIREQNVYCRKPESAFCVLEPRQAISLSIPEYRPLKPCLERT